MRNVRNIVRKAKGIGAIWDGPGDLSVTMEHRGTSSHPDVQESVMKILASLQAAMVPCGNCALPPPTCPPCSSICTTGLATSCGMRAASPLSWTGTSHHRAIPSWMWHAFA